MLILLLSNEEKSIINQIRDTDNRTLLKEKANDGVPFLNHIFRLHKKLFGETCSSCPSKVGGYIQRIKNLNLEKMSKAKNKGEKFVLGAGTLIVFGGTSRSYSEHNITDEVALEYLAKNPNRISLFTKVPENLNMLIDAYNEEKENVKVLKLESAKKESAYKSNIDLLVGLGFIKTDESFTNPCGSTISVDLVYNSTEADIISFLEEIKKNAIAVADDKKVIQMNENPEAQAESPEQESEKKEPVQQEEKAPENPEPKKLEPLKEVQEKVVPNVVQTPKKL